MNIQEQARAYLASSQDSVERRLVEGLLAEAKRVGIILDLLDGGFDAENLHYDTQAVNQAHRVAAGGEAPRRTKWDGNHGGPRCADPECWNDDEPAQAVPVAVVGISNNPDALGRRMSFTALTDAGRDLPAGKYDLYTAQPSQAVSVPDRESILQAVSRGWCASANSSKEMDIDLAIAIANEVEVMLAAAAAKSPEQPT